MTLILKQLFNFFKLLNSDKGTHQIAAGLAAGFVLGMTPFFSLQSILIFILLFVFRIQVGAAFVSAFFFAFMAWILDDLFHFTGTKILEAQAFQGIFTTLYNMPIIPYTRFNNTIVMGSGVIALLMAPFVYIISKQLVIKYREKVVARFQQTKAWKAFKATSFYKWYTTYENLYG